MSINHNYDWIIVGGGVSGITLAEILTREGKSVLLLEKNNTLASETSKEFHEWFHSGALHTLAPDNLLTLRYLLGATDDMFKYYSSFERMNLHPTEHGVNIINEGWFNENLIDFKFKKHIWNPVWLAMISRSSSIIDMIKKHDWLRRRAGSEYGGSKVKTKHWFSIIPDLLKSKDDFFVKASPDFTMNSRVLLSDILCAATSQGLQVLTDRNVISVTDNGNLVTIKTTNEKFQSKNVVVSSPDAISNFFDIPIKVGYAPMAIVDNLPEDTKSFVELDYHISKCINLLTKGNGIGQAGGITLDKKSKIDQYLNFIVSEHKKRNPSLNHIDSYVGIKKELVSKGESRNYLYHINQHSEKVWSVVLGKFTLAFSMAPEFYRRIYHKNPASTVKPFKIDSMNNLISETSWSEIYKNQKD